MKAKTEPSLETSCIFHVLRSIDTVQHLNRHIYHTNMKGTWRYSM